MKRSSQVHLFLPILSKDDGHVFVNKHLSIIHINFLKFFFTYFDVIYKGIITNYISRPSYSKCPIFKMKT